MRWHQQKLRYQLLHCQLLRCLLLRCLQYPVLPLQLQLPSSELMKLCQYC